MKKIIFMIIFLIMANMPQLADARSSRSSSSDKYVGGYTKKNGTYVAPYYRTPKNSTKKDNYSCIDNGRC